MKYVDISSGRVLVVEFAGNLRIFSRRNGLKFGGKSAIFGLVVVQCGYFHVVTTF